MSLKLEHISKDFQLSNERLNILCDVNYEFELNKFYAIVGHSGVGKSTLIKILGLINTSTDGKYYIDEIDVAKQSESDLANFRAKNIGFIFQDYMLDSYLKAYENVMVPMYLNKNIINKKEKALELLKSVGLENRVNHYPSELSGGEQQRVSIARALANDPSYILADEPTGNLDEKNENIIFEKLKELSKQGKCIITVSHSKEIEKYADVVLTIKDGKLEELNNASK